MSELKICPFCGGEFRVTAYDEEFYRLVLGADYECNKDYLIEHVDRPAAAKAKCPLEMATYSTEAEAIDAWNTRAERTCRNLAMPEDAGDSPFHCSECGARSFYGDGTFHIGESFTLNGSLVLADAWHAWRYCPNCGAKVEGEER